MRIFQLKSLHVLAIVFSLVFLAGCSSLARNSATPEAVVAERAQAWADSLLAGNLQGAYEFTSPGYRQFASVGRYHARIAGAGRWSTANVESVECEPKMCIVEIWVEYRVEHLDVDVRRPREYRWIQTEGNWWLYVSSR